MKKAPIIASVITITMVVLGVLIYLLTPAKPSLLTYSLLAAIAVMSCIENIIHTISKADV